MSDLTDCDERLLNAIRAVADPDGAARSLFEIVVRVAGIDYKWARKRLEVLAGLGYVRVERRGRTYPLTIRIVK